MSTPAQAQGVTSWRALISRPAISLLTFWLLLGAATQAPTPLRWLLRGAKETVTRAPAIPALPAASPAAPASETRALAGGGKRAGNAVATPTQPIDDPKRLALAHVAARLARTAKKKGITRIAHYGDSLIDLDHITGPLRRIYQRRYGDAGHGFTLAAKPWPWYNQIGVGLARGGGWSTYRLIGGKRPDGRLGLGGSAAESSGGVKWLRIWTRPEVHFSTIEIAYLAQPRGGSLEIRVDKKTLQTINTAAKRVGSSFARLKVEDSAHRIRLKTRGRVRIFGATLERDGPGIVWDNLPMVSVRFHQLTLIDETHWREQLAHRGSDLVIFQFGANDARNYGGDLERYGARISKVLARLHRALPRASCLVIGPLDQLVKNSRGDLKSPGVVRRVADRQHKVAIEAGCAFWDAQLAMGGPGSMKTWLAQHLALKDMVHLNPKGGALLAKRFDAALTAALARYRE